jgi:hypothetical protein
MQAYASGATAPSAPLRVIDPSSSSVATRLAQEPGNLIIKQLLGELADLVAARVAERLMSPRRDEADEWLDTRRAVEYLGIHRDSLRRLAAEGTIPTEQAGAGCKLYFRRGDLDLWRCGGSGSVIALQGRRDG